uniref:Heme-binding-like protein At3g10130, chloroplastic n=1 Tax=Anthurium amnicola TaxID=1678845 RepID=A0A1D1YZ65_9ARAE
MVLCDPASAISSPGFPRRCEPTFRRHVNPRRGLTPVRAAAAERRGAEGGAPPQRRTLSALEARVSLVAALASQTFSLSQRVLGEFLSEAAKYSTSARRFGEPRNLEEALMAIPDLETVNFKVLKRAEQYEIREVESYFVAETTMRGKRGFDFNSSGQAFNVLAAYLFGKNTASEQMKMTTPVFTRKEQSVGERMEMTTPVITKKVRDEDNWQMSFVMPSHYGGNLPSPMDPSVRIKEVPRKIVAVTAFSGLPITHFMMIMTSLYN